MNNAHLKLNSMSEFTALWNSGERFRKFAEQVYRYLELSLIHISEPTRH